MLSKTEDEVLEEMKTISNFDSGLNNDDIKLSIITSYINNISDKLYDIIVKDSVNIIGNQRKI